MVNQSHPNWHSCCRTRRTSYKASTSTRTHLRHNQSLETLLLKPLRMATKQSLFSRTNRDIHNNHNNNNNNNRDILMTISREQQLVMITKVTRNQWLWTLCMVTATMTTLIKWDRCLMCWSPVYYLLLNQARAMNTKSPRSHQ